MVRTVVNSYCDVNHRIASNYAVLHSFLNTSFDRSDVFLRNSATNDLVFKQEAFARLTRSDFQPAMTILAFTTGLTNKFTFRLNSLADGFAVSNLRITNSAAYFEFAQQTVNDDIQVKLAHTGNNGLGGFRISVNAEGRILFSQFLQGNAHLFLVCFSFRFNCYGNYRIREYHGFQDNFILLVAEGITSGGVLQTYSSCDITSVNHFDFFAVVSMHLQDTADALAFTLSGVVYIRASGQGTGIYAEECQLTNKRVSSNLECQCSKRSLVARRTLVVFTSFRVNAFNRRNISRSRHEVYNCIQQRLYAFVLIGRTAAYRSHFASDSCFTDASFDFFYGQLFAFQVFHHQLVISFSNCFYQSCAVFFCFFLHVFRNFDELFFFTQSIIINDSLHVDQVNHASEGVFEADRQHDRHCVSTQTVLHHLDYVIEVSTGNIHLVYICHTRYAVFVSLTPYGFGLRLNATLSTENCNGTIKYAQGTFNLYSEVNVARSIDDVDAVRIILAFGALPHCSSCSGSNGNTTLLLLNHPVHGSSAFVNFTDFVSLTGVEQNTFGGSSFTSIDVSHDADISCTLKRN